MSLTYALPMSSRKTDEESIRPPSVAYPDLGQRIGNPTPLAMGGFATTLLTLSLAMMGFRGVTVQTVFIGNLCFVACIGLLISAQWEMVKGRLFYGGYGATLAPGLGVVGAYGGLTPEYYNAVGFFVLSKTTTPALARALQYLINMRTVWAVLNVFFLIASVRFNIVYILIFTTVELCFTLDAASHFALADGKLAASVALMKAGGVFGFIAGLLGYYCVAHYLCEDALPFPIPMGDTSRLFEAWRGRIRAKT
ncbi:Fc.00g093570.m01.CDS01 [Cosmosporella sp. VM-42]